MLWGLLGYLIIYLVPTMPGIYFISDVTSGLAEHAAETGSNTFRGREDSSFKQHRGAGAEDQRSGEPDGGVRPRGSQHEHN